MFRVYTYVRTYVRTYANVTVTSLFAELTNLKKVKFGLPQTAMALPEYHLSFLQLLRHREIEADHERFLRISCKVAQKIVLQVKGHEGVHINCVGGANCV